MWFSCKCALFFTIIFQNKLIIDNNKITPKHFQKHDYLKGLQDENTLFDMFHIYFVQSCFKFAIRMNLIK